MAETEKATPFYKDIRFVLALTVALLQVPTSIRHFTDWSVRGAKFSVEADVNNIELPQSYKPAVTADDFSGIGEPSIRPQPGGSSVTLSIKNIGDRPAEEVAVRINDSGVYELTFDSSSEPKPGKFQTEIPVGKLPIAGTCFCKVWTNSRVYPERQQVLIAHSTGSQSVKLPRKTSKPDNDWITMGLMVAIVVAALWKQQNSEAKLKQLSDNNASLVELTKNLTDSLNKAKTSDADAAIQALLSQARQGAQSTTVGASAPPPSTTPPESPPSES